MHTNRNTLVCIASSVIAAGVLAMPLTTVAQTTAAPPLPPGFKVVLNDDRVSVFESTFSPGVVTPMRKYPRRTVYILRGSSELKFTYSDGKTETLGQEAGTVKSRDPEMMSVINLGTTDVVALVVVDKRDLPAK